MYSHIFFPKNVPATFSWAKLKKNYRLYNHGGLGIGFMVALAQIFLHCTPPNYNSRYLCVFDKLIDEGSCRKITYPFNYH